MFNLIERILEIDRDARSQVDAANEAAKSILFDANSQKAAIKKEYTEKIDNRLKIVRESYAKIAEEDIAEINVKKEKRIERIKGVMTENSDKWRAEIIARITE